MIVKYLKYSEIDFSKWNKCISISFNGNIYAYSGYLDIVCQNWEALVLGDYDIVMPLTAKNKYNSTFLQQPPLTFQLGIFSTKKLDEKIILKFLNSIPKKYKYIDISLNKYNDFDNKNYIKNVRITYQLDLIYTYKRNYSKYSPLSKDTIKNATYNKITVLQGITPNSFVNLIRQTDEKKVYKESDLLIIRKLLSFSLLHKLGEVYGAYTADNTLCATGFFLLSNNISVFMLSIADNELYNNGAIYMIIDKFIKNHSEKNITLEFENNNILNSEEIFKSFGAKPFKYYNIKRSKLPWYLKVLKVSKLNR